MTASIDSLSSDLLSRCTFAPPGSHVTCALSGGPDSSALVALAVAAELRVEAVHVDHGARLTSHVDAEIAAQVAVRLGVPFRVIRVGLDDGANFEARARDARRDLLGADVLTGHTADDQAETVLLALLRGAGATGLSAMSPGPTKPLLGLRRTETHRLCAHLGLQVADDPTNTDSRFRRNRVRAELLPLIDDIADRDIVPLLTRSAALIRDDDHLLVELAAAIDPSDARQLANATPSLARRAIRRWIIDHPANPDRRPPDSAGVERVRSVAAGDATACELAGGWRVERTRQRLRLFSTTDVNR
jgi:tRNA(Ile)-lysidine synthase